MDVLPFGSENTNYIDRCLMSKLAYHNGNKRSKEELIDLLVAEIYFNDSHPENKNVTKEGDTMIVWNGSVWEPKDLDSISEHIVQVAKNIINRTFNI